MSKPNVVGTSYANSRTESELGTPQNVAPSAFTDYAAPDIAEDAPYTDTFGWAPSLRLGPETIPDTSRLGTQPLRDYRPDGNQPPEQFWDKLDADKKVRYSVESQDADGWTETKEYPGFPAPSAGANRWAANPRSTPPAEPRPTQQLSPATYSFLRPFMQGQAKMGERFLNGIHFSMASHKRTFEILGMAPQRMPGNGTRNTYRLEPTPWDMDLTDKPPQNQQPVIAESLPTVDVAYQSRSWRLS